MDLTNLIPKDVAAAYAWLGSVPENWVRFRPGPPDPKGNPTTDADVDFGVLARAPGADSLEGRAMTAAVRKAVMSGRFVSLASFDAVTRLLGDGPKMYRPTEEQFESMEHVELRLPIKQFQTPYPALLIGVPPACRKRLCDQHGVTPDRAPNCVLVRRRAEPDGNVMVTIMHKFPESEVYHLFQDQPGNPNIEVPLRRRVVCPGDRARWGNYEGDHAFAQESARAALNLCLMLTHFGCQTGGPLDPAAYKKHRTVRHLQHLKYADVLAITMKQTIVVREQRSPAQNPPGPGLGIEVRPHWRKGHWRAYPGQGAARAAGNNVPLLIVRPCLVRRDRMVGQTSETEVVYLG
jgi:hypothetical protein